MSRILAAVRGPAGGLAVGVYASQFDSAKDFTRNLLDVFRPAATALFASAEAAAAPAAAIQDPAVAAALAAMERALHALTQSQRSSGASRALLWVGLPLAVALAVSHFGWARIGWVTGESLALGLQQVREYVGEQVVALSETLMARFTRVEATLAATAESVHQVSVSTAEVKAEVLCVAASLATLEQRMTPLETNAATAAKGVEVLCELVKTSGLLNNASSDSLRRLNTFTGGVPGAIAAPRELDLEGAARPELTMAPSQALPSPPSLPAPQLPTSSMPAFMRALVDAPGAH